MTPHGRQYATKLHPFELSLMQEDGRSTIKFAGDLKFLGNIYSTKCSASVSFEGRVIDEKLNAEVQQIKLSVDTRIEDCPSECKVRSAPDNCLASV